MTSRRLRRAPSMTAAGGSPTTQLAELETPTKPTPRATPPPRPTLFRKTRQVVHDEASDSDSDTEAGSSDASSGDESDGSELATERPAPAKKMRRVEAPPNAELLAIAAGFGDGIELAEDDDEGFRRRKGRRSSAHRTKRSTTARGLRGEGVARRLPGVPRSSSEGRVSARGRLSREDVDAAIAQRQAEVAKAAGIPAATASEAIAHSAAASSIVAAVIKGVDAAPLRPWDMNGGPPPPPGTLLDLRKTEVAFPRVAFGAFRALIAALSRRPRRHNPLRSAVMRGCPPLASGFKLWSESPTAAGVLRAAEEQHASDAASKKKGALAGGEGEEAEGGASAALADNGGAGAVHEPAAFSKAAAARTLWAAWEDGLSQAERTAYEAAAAAKAAEAYASRLRAIIDGSAARPVTIKLAAPSPEDVLAYAHAEAAAGLRQGVSVAGGSPTSTMLGAAAFAGKAPAASSPARRARVATGKLAALGGSAGGGALQAVGDSHGPSEEEEAIERVAALKAALPGLPIRRRIGSFLTPAAAYAIVAHLAGSVRIAYAPDPAAPGFGTVTVSVRYEACSLKLASLQAEDAALVKAAAARSDDVVIASLIASTTAAGMADESEEEAVTALHKRAVVATPPARSSRRSPAAARAAPGGASSSSSSASPKIAGVVLADVSDLVASAVASGGALPPPKPAKSVSHVPRTGAPRLGRTASAVSAAPLSPVRRLGSGLLALAEASDDMATAGGSAAASLAGGKRRR